MKVPSLQWLKEIPSPYFSAKNRVEIFLSFFHFPKENWKKKKKQKKALLDSFQLMLHVVTRHVKLHLLC